MDPLMAAHLETLDSALGAFCVGGQRCGKRTSVLKAIREELLRPRLRWEEAHKGAVLNVDPSGRVYSTFEGEVVRWH